MSTDEAHDGIRRPRGSAAKWIVCPVYYGGIPENRQIMTWGAVLVLMAMVFFVSWPVWKAIKFKSVNAATYARTKAAAEKNPRLQPAWDIALQGDVLTWPEAKVILESAGKKAEPDE